MTNNEYYDMYKFVLSDRELRYSKYNIAYIGYFIWAYKTKGKNLHIVTI